MVAIGHVILTVYSSVIVQSDLEGERVFCSTNFAQIHLLMPNSRDSLAMAETTVNTSPISVDN